MLHYNESHEEDVNVYIHESLKVNTNFVILDKFNAALEKRKKKKYSFLFKNTKRSLSELDLCAN